MLGSLFNRIFAPEPTLRPLSGVDAEVAVAALLVRVARSDEQYTSEEALRIDRILMRRLGVGRETAAQHRKAAEKIESEAPDTVRFTRLIKERIALEDRAGVLAAMWEITYADGERNPEEESLVRLAAGLLGINDRDSGLLRQSVLSDMGLMA